MVSPSHNAHASAVADTSARAVTFIFNGGPGSSSQWLHTGAFGPKRVQIPAEPINAAAPPYPLVDNALSILDVSDLVFIDPIGTGYSRALAGKDPKDYWGLLEDARSIADLIQAWIGDQQRWSSPKFLAGESYGTTRASLVAELLTHRYIGLNELALISPVLDYQNSRPRAGDRSELRIRPDRFVKELLREENSVVGRLDGRYRGVDSDRVGELAESDPTVDAVGNAFTAALNRHLSELGVRMERPYVSIREIDDWHWLLEKRVLTEAATSMSSPTWGGLCGATEGFA